MPAQGPSTAFQCTKSRSRVQASPLNFNRNLTQTLAPQTPGGGGDGEEQRRSKMIYDVNSPLFRSFLSQKGGASDKRKMEEQKPKEQRPKANENKPVMNE
ncbi:hypothetical protein C2845_PM05G19770 [Panicum miliaceum]|uniref:Wound-induced basic protein n=3 Tax=Paniceae TaxID=147428 RepID=A0A3L6SX02_PANMI|nr:hypothetical protein C2845_PM05G19770 [Panicum miliaceum]